MNQKTPTIWNSQKRKALFEKEQKYGLSEKVKKLTEKHRLQAIEVSILFC